MSLYVIAVSHVSLCNSSQGSCQHARWHVSFLYIISQVNDVCVCVCVCVFVAGELGRRSDGMFHSYILTHTHTCILYNNTHTWMLYVCVLRVNRFEGPDGGRDLSTSLDKRGAPQGWTFADLCLPCRLAICVCIYM